MTIPAVQIQKRLTYWLERFGMAEWIGSRPREEGVPRVRVLIRTRKKMAGEVGRCTWHAEECTADIELLRGQGEETLVHEILHLALQGHTTYSDAKYSEMHERALNRLAGAYLAPTSETPPLPPGPA